MIIRHATAADGDGVAAIYGPVVATTTISFELEVPTGAEMGERIARVGPENVWLVAEVDGHVVGYAYSAPFRARPAYRATRETTVYVHPDHQGQGVARRLLEELLGRLAGAGVHRVVAGIALPNDPSVALHEGLGFTLVGRFTEVGHKFGQWHDVAFWELALDESAPPPDPAG